MKKPPPIPLKSGKFTLTELSGAFRVDPRTLQKCLDKVGGAGPPWTIHEAHSALLGDGSLEALRSARTQLSLEQRRLAELDRLSREGKLVDVTEMRAAVDTLGARLRRAIEGLDSDDYTKSILLWELRSAVRQPGAAVEPRPVPPEKAEIRGHHDWRSWCEKNRCCPEAVGDLEYERGLDPLERPWFFNTDAAPNMTLLEIVDLRSEWLRTEPGKAYLRAVEQSTMRTARLKMEKSNESDPSKT